MPTDATLENLSAALAAGRFPTAVAAQAQSLCDALATPARITLFGMSNVGKTGVLNLLAGAPLISDQVDLGTIRLEYGAQEKTEMTLATGEFVSVDGLPDTAKMAGMQPALTRIQAPLPALKKISLMEIGLNTDPTSQARAITWAAKQTDIAIWCTTGFNEAEEALWLTTPERMRDHAILLRTQMDKLGAMREAVQNDLARVAGSEFAYSLGVSVSEANAATANGAINKDMMRASGGMKLISTILSEIDSGQRNIIDQADVLMRKHAAEDAGASAPTPAPAPAPKPTPKPAPAPKPAPTPSPEPAQAKAPAPEPKPRLQVKRRVKPPVEPQPAPRVEPKAEPKPAPQPEQQPEPVAKAEPTATPDSVIAAFDQAVAHLSKVGADLVKETEHDSDAILDTCFAALTWLTNHLEDADLPEVPIVIHTQAMTQDAEDLVQLMRIEGNKSGHTDAILALLQLKRGFQSVRAA